MSPTYIYKKLLVVVLLLFGTSVVWIGVYHETREGVLTVAFLDVGQGDAIFIESPVGTQVLIDGGPDGSVLRELGKVMPFYDRTIDVVVGTHPDQDHIGGLPAVLERYEVETVINSDPPNDTAVFYAYVKRMQEEGATLLTARRGMVLDLGGGAFLEILFPDRDVEALDPNNASVIAKLIYGETGFMLTGDAGKAMEEYMVSLYGESLRSTVLKAGHHGSKTSSGELFVGYVDPEYAVVSAGEDNRFGHPHQEVLDTFERFDIDVVSTAERGTIIFTSDGIEATLRR